MSDARSLATVELLGSMTYGQLRAFDITARAVRLAPDARRADRMAAFADREYHGYVELRDRLLELTDLAAPVIDRQKPRFDGFFDQAPLDDWVSACAFFATGLPMAADFVIELAPTVADDRTRELLTSTLAGRDRFEVFAVEEVTAAIGDDQQAGERLGHLVADVLGRALTEFQGAISDTDALAVLLGGEGDEAAERSDALVRRLAVTVLEGHRRRMAALGLQDPD